MSRQKGSVNKAIEKKVKEYFKKNGKDVKSDSKDAKRLR